MCINETIEGLALHQDPDIGPNHVLVSDMTSSLFSRPVDVSKYGVIYASSGKNLGPAGCCLVIVREDLLNQSLPQVLKLHYNVAAGFLFSLPCADGFQQQMDRTRDVWAPVRVHFSHSHP